MKPIKHFYHIYASGQWLVPVQEHLQALVTSGLIDELDEFNIGIVGTELQRQEVKDYLNSVCEGFIIVTETASGWEQETLDKLYEAALNSEEPFWAFYAHTKGAANTSAVNISWRKLMTEQTVLNWKNTVKHLDGYDAVGALWMRDREGFTRGGPCIGRPGFFAGTFWWANSTYLASLGYPHRLNRWCAEGWIGQSGRIVSNQGIVNGYHNVTRDIRIYDTHPGLRSLLGHLQRRGGK